MKRRILSILLAALLLLPSALTAAATAPVTITSADVRGNVGDTVTVTLNIAIEPPKLGQTMDSLQFVLEYDSAALEYVGIQEVSQDRINILGTQYICNVTTKTGGVVFAASATNGASGSGTLMRVKFRILSAFSTMLVLKKVSYSFVTKNGTTQDRRQGGTINLGRITGQSVPTTVTPAFYTPDPFQTQDPVSTGYATDEPRFPVTEVTLAPGASPTATPEEGDSDILAYIVFGLFIVVAILICVVLTLMIVRRGKNKSKYLEDDEGEQGSYDGYEEEYYEDDGYEDYEEEPAPRKKKQPESKKKKPAKVSYEEDEDDEPPIRIVRRGKK